MPYRPVGNPADRNFEEYDDPQMEDDEPEDEAPRTPNAADPDDEEPMPEDDEDENDDDREEEENGDAMEQDGDTGDEDHDDGEVYEDEYENPDDAMTWETLSTISQLNEDDEDNLRVDDWFPMSHRDTQMPNFSLPTLSRAALLNPNSDAQARGGKDEGPEPSAAEVAEKADADFQAYIDVMRPKPTRQDLAEMVLDYFLFHGHSEVIETYCREMKLPFPVEAMEDMNVRNNVKADILEGKMEVVLEKLNKISPKLMEDENVNFAVRKQHIIEMIRAGKTNEPVEYFRRHLLKDDERPADDKMEIIENIFTVMVIGVNETSEFHVYLEQEEREVTAKEVNSAMLHAMGKAKSSRIDLFAKSLVYMTNRIVKTQMTPVEVANSLFARPYGVHDLIDKFLDHTGSLDLTQDFC